MSNKLLFPIILLAALMALSACSTSAGATTAPTEVQAQQTYSDPFAYCAAVGQIDAPDVRYSGPKMSDALFKDYLTAAKLDVNGDYPETFKQMTIWRCMNSKVYACNFGANIPCDSKANTDQTPTQAIMDYCTQNQNSDFIPMSVTGHNVIYNWHCVNGAPSILNQIDTVDAAGYQSSFWVELQPGQ
jgi:hypothetical protein